MSEHLLKVIATQVLRGLLHNQSYHLMHCELDLDHIIMDADYNVKILDYKFPEMHSTCWSFCLRAMDLKIMHMQY